MIHIHFYYLTWENATLISYSSQSIKTHTVHINLGFYGRCKHEQIQVIHVENTKRLFAEGFKDEDYNEVIVKKSVKDEDLAVGDIVSQNSTGFRRIACVAVLLA